jgi:hypothetical protein
MVQISIMSVELKMCHRIICIGISTQYAHNLAFVSWNFSCAKILSAEDRKTLNFDF